LKLEKAKGTIYIAVESLYSMNGDVAPLKEITEIAKEFNAYLIVDAAHSGGVFGTSGRGLVEELKLENDVFARLITFGKAYGYHGAAVLGSQQLKEFLINFSRSFIYTTALPPEAYNQIQARVTKNSIREYQNRLASNIALFRAETIQLSIQSDVKSPIQMFRIGSIEKTKKLAHELQNAKMAVKPIYSPTIKRGEESIRICIHASNSTDEIGLLCAYLNQLI
jgi:8-amino-7-oxononanoate synthase